MRLLLIEDNQPLREALHAGLTAAGHDVQTCADGLAGMEDSTEVTFTDQVAPLFLRSGKLTYMVQPRRELL